MKTKNITLGRIQGILPKKEVLTEAELNHHVHIVGASGFGKTVFLSHIVKDRIEQGKGVLFLDLKGDIDTIEKYMDYARRVGREKDVQVLSLSDQKISSNYNLVSTGTATQLRDKIMNCLNWSEEYYKNQSASFLLKLLIGLSWLRDNKQQDFSLATVLAAAIHPEKVEEICLQIPESETFEKEVIESCYQFIKENGNYNSIQGLRTQLESLVLSDFGGLLKENDDGIDLFKTVTEGKIIFIFLDTRRYSDTAKSVGRFILQDLKMVSARIDAEIPKTNRKPFVCIIDEFADLAQEDFIGFLDRARSSKMSIVVAHQEICDLLRISPEFAGRLMGNTSTLYAFLQKRPESAEIISKMAGTKKAWKETVRSSKLGWFDMPTGEKSLREVEEFFIHPNIIKSLGVGECVVVKKYPRARSHRVRIFPEAI